MGDHAAHRNRDAALVAEHQPDLDVAAVLAQRADGRRARARAAERVERHVRAAAGRLEHRCGRLDRRARRSPPRPRARARAPAWPGRCRPRPRARPAAAAIITAASPTPPQPCTATQSPARTAGRGRCIARVGGHEAAAERRRRDEAERVRQADEVQVGVRQRDVLRERARAGEARLVVEVADLRLPRQARSRSARSRRQNGTVTRSPTRHAPCTSGPSATTVPASSCPGTCGGVDVGVVAHPGVPVGAADAGRARPRRRRRPAAAPGSGTSSTTSGPPNSLEDRGPHQT